MKKICLFVLVLLLIPLTVPAEKPYADWFLIDAQLAEQSLLAENPLPFFKDGLTTFFLENPTAAIYFGSEMNLNNGQVGDSHRQDLGERFIFGRTLNASIAKTWKGDATIVAKEVIRLLYGPWYDKVATSYSTQKNLGWFSYHLDLNTGDFIKVNPLSPDMGIRVFHITEYNHKMRTVTLGVFFDKDCEIEGHYWCKVTIIRKAKNGYGN